MPIQMLASPGICLHSTVCGTARSGQRIMVPLRAQFTCPECRHSLAEPLQTTDFSGLPKPVLAPQAMAAASAMVLACAMYLGQGLGGAQIARAGLVAAAQAHTVLALAAPARPGPDRAPLPAARRVAVALAQPAPAPAGPPSSDRSKPDTAALPVALQSATAGASLSAAFAPR
jgi:hypothetical protein